MPYSSKGACRQSSGDDHGAPTQPVTDQEPTGKTPYEAWHRRTLAVKHLHTFNCLAYIKELSTVNKLSDRSTSGVFISYVEGVKAYWVLDSVTRRVRTT
jgi:hypothetical protein